MLKQKTVYFREEDLELWEKIPNKAQWLHDALNPGGTYDLTPKTVAVVSPSTKKALLKLKDPGLDKRLAGKTPYLIVESKPIVEKIAEVFDVSLCKHGASPEYCKYAKVVNGKKVCK